jgi:hypothetical protein
MMMQYLYYGGTESMEIPTADILEVRHRGPQLPGISHSLCVPGSIALDLCISQPYSQKQHLKGRGEDGSPFEDLMVPRAFSLIPPQVQF